jgi:hypothetical protein
MGLTRRATVVALLFMGLAVGLLTPPRHLADATIYLLMTDSLWMDGDLAYTPHDLTRAQALAFADHPKGVFLIKHAAGYGYAKPPLYSVLAVPFYALFGVRGFLALNGVLLAALVLLGADVLAHRLPWRLALPASALVFACSVTPAYLLWIDPFLLCSVLIAGAVAAVRRDALAISAILLAAAASCRPPYIALALAPALLCAFERRWRPLARFAAAGIATTAVLLGVNWVAHGQSSPYGGERYYFLTLLPFQVPGVEPPGGRAHITAGGGSLPSIAALVRTSLDFLVGRFAGVLVYFPGLLACALWARRWDGEKLVWLAGLAAACATLIVAFPHNTMGGQQALGNRFFVLLPVALVFVDFLAWSVWRGLATAALALLAVPVMQAPVYLSLNAGRQMLDVPYRYLPVEWLQAGRIRFPIEYPGGMAALTDQQYEWDGEGVWTRGGAAAEFVFVVIGDDLAPPRVRLWSKEQDVRITDGGRLRDLAWQTGRDVEVVLQHPVAQYRDESYAGARVSAYTLGISTRTGTYGYDIGGGNDSRYLGVFVRPVPTPPPNRPE